MALKRESGFVGVFLAVVLLFSSSAAQNPTPNTENRARSQNPSAAIDRLTKTTSEDDFRRRVAVRWQAAREGQIELYVLSDNKDPEIYRIRVVVTRVPLGADGMTAVHLPPSATWGALLKLDDELRVRITSAKAGTLAVEPLVPRSPIRHLDPGGRAEWTWIVKKRAQEQKEDRLQLQADVVYRRDFSPAGEPIVTYRSAETVISLTAHPANSPTSPHTLVQEQ